jgi:SAM-dependent methyltransferase
MLNRIRKWVRGSAWYNYNQVGRDRWIAKEVQEVKAGSTVLDVGAGSAPYRPLFAHCDYQTQDFAQLAPDQLRGLQGYSQITYVCDATAIPVPAGTFDVVLCTEVLEHVPDPKALVQELSRILKPKGTLLMTAPLGSGLHQEPYHYYGGFTPFWFQRFLTEAGFTNIQCLPNGGFYRLYGQETMRLSRMLAVQHNPFWLAPLLLPIWTVSILAAIVMPPLCVLLDRLDTTPRFTCGYHIKAERSEHSPRATPTVGSGLGLPGQA